MRVLLATAALLALGMGGAGAVQYSQGPDSALDNNDPYYVDTSATPAPMRFAEARTGAGMFAADGSLFCRGKQCPLSRTAAGEPLCCPTTDHCCPATYRCDESDASSVKCIPTASTPTASGSNGGTSVTVSASESSDDDASEDSGSDDSSEDSTADAGTAPAADAATGAAAAEDSEESSEDSAGGATEPGAAESSSADESSSDAAAAVPKFRQNIIIVKNINVLTKMNQKADGDASSGSSEDSEESSEESSESS